MTAIRNVVAFWNREQLGIELSSGVDEVALVADAYEARYGMPTADFVAMQLEYPRHGGAR